MASVKRKGGRVAAAAKPARARKAPAAAKEAIKAPLVRPVSTVAANALPVLNFVSGCEALAAQVHDVIRRFHSSVASPLASIGLQLELLRLDPATPPKLSAEIGKIAGELDELIVAIRESNRALRGVEKQIREQQPVER